MLAFIEGKTIEVCDYGKSGKWEWKITKHPGWNWNENNYRVRRFDSYAAGTKFLLNGEEYLLCTVSQYSWALIGINSGNRWVEPVVFPCEAISLSDDQLKIILSSGTKADIKVFDEKEGHWVELDDLYL